MGKMGFVEWAEKLGDPEMEIKPLAEKAFRPNDDLFNSSINPVVQVAENATYALLDPHPHMTRDQEIDIAQREIRRVQDLPLELIPPLAKNKVAEAKRLIKSYGGKVTFTREEKKYLRKKFDLDPPNFYK